LLFSPKKAKAKAKAGPSEEAKVEGPPGADHIFNIYADQPELEVKPDNWYPDWLWELEKPRKSYGELSMMFCHGVNIEQAEFPDYRRFLRLHRVLCIKVNNLRLKKSKRRSHLKIGTNIA